MNKVGSSEAARQATQAGKPVMVVTERTKLVSEAALTGMKKVTPGIWDRPLDGRPTTVFEEVPAHIPTAVILPRGVVEPGEPGGEL